MNADTVSHVLQFCGNAYLYFATVNKTWRRAYGTSTKTAVCEAVASARRVGSILPTLRLDDCLNNAAFFHACKFGNLCVLDLLLANKRPVALYVCTAGAVAGQNLRALSWAVENNFPLDRFVCDSAARAGNSEMLTWALENGCPWDFAKIEK